MNTTRTGDALENRIYDLLNNEIGEDRFWAKKENCKIFKKKGYFSKDRGKDIIFDVAIEIYLAGAKDYSSLVLIECKNYTHAVPVDDAEEFFTKVQQVAAANCKAVIASTASFQSGARTFAKSKGMGLLRYFDSAPFKWELQRSPSATARSCSPDLAPMVEEGLSNQLFDSQAFDLFMQSPVRDTNSLWDFFEDLILNTTLTSSQVRKVANSRSKLTNQVPFFEKDELESRSAEILAAIGYAGGQVSLEAICDREKERNQLKVIQDAPMPESDKGTVSLGRITFDPLVIEVYSQESSHPGRERFTLAHELAHHLLKHGKYLVHESCDESDFVLHRRSLVKGSDISRMEFQANFLASSLLMPRTNFIEDFRKIVSSLEIANKGFGALYVDNQPCNLRNYDLVTYQLMRNYGASRAAVSIRLESLNLLQDVRSHTGPRAIQSILSSL
jgi:Zn-dependent peptidase ImmA (M78 family)